MLFRGSMKSQPGPPAMFGAAARANPQRAEVRLSLPGPEPPLLLSRRGSGNWDRRTGSTAIGYLVLVTVMVMVMFMARLDLEGDGGEGDSEKRPGYPALIIPCQFPSIPCMYKSQNGPCWAALEIVISPDSSPSTMLKFRSRDGPKNTLSKLFSCALIGKFKISEGKSGEL